MTRVEGSESLALPRSEVWRLLNDPDALGTAIPGCRGFERAEDSEHRYRTAIKVAVGAVTGVYEGTVEYLDVERPERCTIVVSGRGDKGMIDGRGEITLEPQGGHTQVGYRGDFKLVGPVAGVGQRLAPGVSRKMIVETLRNLERSGLETSAPVAQERDRAGGTDGEGATEEAPGAVPAAEAAPAPETAPARRSAPAAPPPSGEQVFKPFSISPGRAFGAGCVLGLAVGALIGLIL